MKAHTYRGSFCPVIVCAEGKAHQEVRRGVGIIVQRRVNPFSVIDFIFDVFDVVVLVDEVDLEAERGVARGHGDVRGHVRHAGCVEDPNPLILEILWECVGGGGARQNAGRVRIDNGWMASHE